jgi:hypothetical protein
MSDFFGRLELQLRAAAERPPRRAVGFGTAARGAGPALAVVVALAVVLIPALLPLGGDQRNQNTPASVERPRPDDALPPVGTVIPKGEGEVPRDSESTVVATGAAPVVGPWQLEVSESTRLADPKTGEEFQPAGLPCLSILLVDPPKDVPVGRSGGCGEFPRTPGFGRGQHSLRDGSGQVREILVYGRAPEQAAAVELTADGGVSRRVEPFEGPASVPGDFYLIAVSPDLKGGRVNWIDRDGNEGSRGIALLPP